MHTHKHADEVAASSPETAFPAELPKSIPPATACVSQVLEEGAPCALPGLDVHAGNALVPAVVGLKNIPGGVAPPIEPFAITSPGGSSPSLPARVATASTEGPPTASTASRPAPALRVEAAGEEPNARKTAQSLERTEEIFRQIRLHLSPGTRHAVIQLVPADLGRISIRITVRGSRITGEIRAESSETLERLEAHVPELRSILARNGFDTTELSLGRHGDEMPRARPENVPLREERNRFGSSEVVPLPSTAVLLEDRVDTYA